MPPRVVLPGAAEAPPPGAPTPISVMSLRITSAPNRPMLRPIVKVPISLLANIQSGSAQRVVRAATIRAAAVVGGDARIESQVRRDVDPVLSRRDTKHERRRQQTVVYGRHAIAVRATDAGQTAGNGHRTGGALAARIHIIGVDVAIDRERPRAIGGR